MSEHDSDDSDDEIKISKTYKKTATQSCSTLVLAMLASGTIVKVFEYWLQSIL